MYSLRENPTILLFAFRKAHQLRSFKCMTLGMFPAPWVGMGGMALNAVNADVSDLARGKPKLLVCKLQRILFCCRLCTEEFYNRLDSYSLLSFSFQKQKSHSGKLFFGKSVLVGTMLQIFICQSCVTVLNSLIQCIYGYIHLHLRMGCVTFKYMHY